MNFKTIILVILSLVIGGAAGYYFGYDVGFEKGSKGKTSVTQDLVNQVAQSDSITVSNPSPNQVIRSPLAITGEAKGTWFFEASFPVYLYDSKGNLIIQGVAQAEGEWMTEDFVPFSLTLDFDKPSASTGELVLMRDNPSGLPENSEELRIPVRFK